MLGFIPSEAREPYRHVEFKVVEFLASLRNRITDRRDSSLSSEVLKNKQ